MFKGIRNAFSEFEHVVWPTKKETQQYFIVTVITIICFCIFLFVLGSAFSNGLFGLKETVNPSIGNFDNTFTQGDIDLESLVGDMDVSAVTADGDVLIPE